DAKLSGDEPVALPLASILAFVRIVTNRRVFPFAKPISAAWQQASDWLSCPAVWIPQPTERHVDLLGELLSLPGMGGNLVTDAHLAALAIEHGLTLCSADTDFARFKALRWVNPLA
ncbi:MAG: PIN domain-containing protein, partial [Alphaproteobacteria bacterium]|nr:PIN domain-containing protein [Alphaproteobacteria bacterium]